MEKLKRKLKRGKNIVYKFAVIAFLIYGLVSIVSLNLDVASKEQELEDLNEQVMLLEQQNNEALLQSELEENNDYIEKVAREKLGYAYPNERIYVDISGS